MKVYNIIFYGNSNGSIFNVDITAKEWVLKKAGDNTIVHFFNEDGNLLAMFRWDCIVGICDITGLRESNERSPEEMPIEYEFVEETDA